MSKNLHLNISNKFYSKKIHNRSNRKIKIPATPNFLTHRRDVTSRSSALASFATIEKAWHEAKRNFQAGEPR